MSLNYSLTGFPLLPHYSRSASLLSGSPAPSGGMSREAMRAALQELQLGSPSASLTMSNGRSVPAEA